MWNRVFRRDFKRYEFVVTVNNVNWRTKKRNEKEKRKTFRVINLFVELG